MTPPLVSVVVTTKNEEANIKNCLQSIISQSYKNVEIIVVDNHSTDKTKEEVDRMCHSREGGNPASNHISFYSYGPERSAQRNFGVEKAQGMYILYVDADMLLSSDLVENCVDYMCKNNCIALHISEQVMGKGYWGQVRRFERSFYDGTVIDGARFMQKKTFLKIKGFDENLSGPEDWDIDKRIKKIGPICLLPNNNSKTVIFHNEAQFNVFKYINKKQYYGKSFATYIEKWGKDDPDIKKQFGLWYRYFGVFMEQGKWKKLLINPHLAFGMYFLRILVGVNFLLNE
ncbi:MAG: glycosyltransferase [bacterium]